MASVYLQGGPCNGKVATLTPAEADTGELVCGGDLYKNPYTGQHHGGHLVFIDAGKAPAPGGGSGGVRAPHALSAWGDLRNQVNAGLPTMLKTVGTLNRDAARTLARRRRVGH